MNTVSLNQTGNIYAPQRVVNSTVNGAQNVSNPQSAQKYSSVPAGVMGLSNVRTELVTLDEKQKYMTLLQVADVNDRKNLQLLLRNGTLLNNNSDDKSTTLDNLCKMVTTQRATGLTPQMVLKETLSALANPFVINQTFGDIPTPYVKPIVDNIKPNEKARNCAIDKNTINVKYSSSCVSASIEFNLAKQSPAEFARFAEGLTSPNISVEKTVDLKNLTENKQDALRLLDSFEIPYLRQGADKVRVLLAPDKNAIIRARIQNSHKDLNERSLVDALMQSTFMNVGSQQSYDSLTDMRGGKFSEDNKGLVEYEKTFTESIVQNKSKTSVTYQVLDDNARITGYSCDFSKMIKQIASALKSGENVIVGYTETDASNRVINGHEITIVGIKKDKNGELVFICNDTDDNKSCPVTHKVKELLPKIHHAGLPSEIAA